ncbi:MAG TPA: 4-hydroxy-tetrahydrodipicolinate synthase [Fibrobacteres bacterium]|nr:4-hydroxy-tetrahydrodipicolinate synthase [Fibrobacterota bacterium]
MSAGAELRGVWPALFTPLKNDDPKRLRNSLDFDKARLIIDDLIAEGVSGLVPVGTTGQSPTVSTEQHLDFIRFTVDYVNGRVPVIAGAGSNSTRESVDMIQSILKSFGDMAVLCVTGYYNNPPQEGLAAHYETLSRETGAKIVLYNVPARTASYLEPDTLIRLASDRNIIGLKQAVDFRNPGKHRDDTARVVQSTKNLDFGIVSGEDDGVAAMMELGGAGVITASGSIPEASRLFLKLVAAFASGNSAQAKTFQDEIMAFVKLVFSRKNPIPLGTFFNSPLFLPLVSVRETKGGEELEKEILAFIRAKAPLLAKYHP